MKCPHKTITCARLYGHTFDYILTHLSLLIVYTVATTRACG